MNKRTRIMLIVGLIVLFLIGLLFMAYPKIASRYYEKYGSVVQSEYAAAVEAEDTRTLDKAFVDAMSFNEALAAGTLDRLNPEENGYFDLLDLSGNGIMAYVRIPKINIELPIYHGTSNAVLNVGAGHMPESSLPVGGDSTHTVITAHSGMATSPMFSDITLLEPGDVFYIDVLNRTLAYQVMDESDIKIVDPNIVDDIQVFEGKDLCTLITCYPFGVNTQRYLVRGHRIEQEETASEESTPAKNTPTEPKESVWESKWQNSVKIGFIIAVCVILSCGGTLLAVTYVQKRKGPGRYE